MALPKHIIGLICLVVVTLCMVSCTATFSSSGVNCTLYMNETCAQMCRPKCPSKTKKLYIQGFVPATNEDFRSETIVPAAFAAIDEINGDCDILKDYELIVEFANTKCDPSEAAWQLVNSIILDDAKRNISKIMFLGGGCSLATEALAALAGRVYKIPILSYGASSPALSDKKMFPRFFRTLPSEIQANSARIALIHHFNWTRVATLHETEAIFSSAVDNFHDQYDKFNTTHNDTDYDLIVRSFTDNATIALHQIKNEDIHIILGYYYEETAVVTLCNASNASLTGDGHVWMYISWYDKDWFTDPDNRTNCNTTQLEKAVQNSFFFDSYNYGEDLNAETDTGSPNLSAFNDKYECFHQEFFNNPQTSSLTNDTTRHDYYTYTYDAVWTIAKALNETEQELQNRNLGLTLGDYKHLNNNTQIIPDLITEFLNKTNFTGVSGRVVFDDNGDRINLNVIYQLRDDGSGNLKRTMVAIHNPYLPFDENKSLVFNYDLNFLNESDPIFQGCNCSIPPKDRSTPIDIPVFLISDLIYVCDVVIVVAIVIAVALLIFNIVTYQKPLIRDSAPLINIIIVCGCIVMLATSFLLGIDSKTPDTNSTSTMTESDVTPQDVYMYANKRFGIICNLRLWFFTIGFTLSFGALFAKTWQVYRVYTNQNLKNLDFQMWRFFLIVGIFLLIDFVYLSFWTGVFPLELRIQNTTINETNGNNYERCHCDKFAYLIGALYVYKGLLVLFGLFLAYQSRNVKYRFINDSRFGSIAIYIVVILIGIGAPLSLVLSEHNFVDATYGLAIFMIVASSLACLLIIHIPKFIYMAKGLDTMIQENSKEEITESSGLQLGTANTIFDGPAIKSAEDEFADLTIKNASGDIELKELETCGEELHANIKPRTGSDNNSGVLVAGDGTETFSTENDEQQRPNTATPSDGETQTPGTTL